VIQVLWNVMLCATQVVADISKDHRLLDPGNGGTMIPGNVTNYTSKNMCLFKMNIEHCLATQ